VDTGPMVAIVERASRLLRERPEDYRQIYVDHVEPIYMDMLPVHLGYVEAFAALAAASRDLAVSEAELLLMAAEWWWDVRGALERFDQDLGKLLLASPQEIPMAKRRPFATQRLGLNFAENVALYFHCYFGQRNTFPSGVHSRFHGAIELIEETLAGRQDRKGCVGGIGWAEALVPYTWERISRDYARLRAMCR